MNRERYSNSRRNRVDSVGASVYTQALRASNECPTVTPLNLTRIEHGHDSSGNPTLEAIFSAKGGGKAQPINISFLLNFPNLCEMFADGFLAWGYSLTAVTRREGSNTLRRSFFGFLDTQGLHQIRPEDLDEEILAQFHRYMVQPKHGSGGLHPSTIGSELGIVRNVLRAIAVGKWGALALPIAERLPWGPSGGTRRTNPVEVLPLDQIRAIVNAAENEIRKLINRRERGQYLLEQGLRELRMGKTNYRSSFSLCFAAVSEKYPGVIPDGKFLIKNEKALGYAIVEIHKSLEISSYLYPTARDLAPIVLLLAMTTVFNPDTLLSLNWSNVDENVDRLGTPAIKIIGMKARATKDLVRLLEAGDEDKDQISVKGILKLLRELTSRIRPFVAEPEHRDRLFIFIQQVKLKQPKSFGSPRACGPSADITWVKALKNFCKDNQIPYFTLGQLRPTLLDMALSNNGDLALAKELGNHKNPHTTWTHYTSSAVKKRFQERLGEVLLLRQRWIETEGQIDPRVLTIQHDHGAATPGFLCLDPFDSPRPNQQKGKLCKAYGECPDCPLVAARLNDPISVGYYLALRESVFLAQSNMSPQSWLHRWVPIITELNTILKSVDSDVMREAQRFHITLPPVG